MPLIHLAAYICQSPIAVISLVDAERQWFKSKIGLTETQTSHVIAFCAHTILSDELFVVPDALADKRFVDNPLVTGEPHIRFYCGAPLTTPDGYRIGTLSVIDRVPRELSAGQLEAMRVLSRQVMDHLNLDRRHKELLTAVGERLNAEQALVASQTKFQRLSDCTSSAIYIYSGERFLYANPAAQAITGYSLEELMSLSLWDLVHPDFHEALKARARAVAAGDQTPARFEFPIIAKDGEIRWMDFTAASIEFEGQKARIGTAIDITKRKQVERALRLSEERFALAVAGTDAGIWDWDLTTNTVYYSPRWKSMLGYAEEDLPNVFTTWESLIHPDDRERARATLNAYVEGKTTGYELEHRLRHKDGSYRWILARGALLRDADGHPRRMAGSHLDVTERKLAERLKSIERQALERVSRSEPLSEMMEFLIRSIESLSDGGICSIPLVDQDGHTLQRGAAPTLPEAYNCAVGGWPIGPQHGSCGTAAYRKASVIVTDIATDPLWARWTEAKDLARQYGLKACTSVPIVSTAGEVLGTCAMYYHIARGPTDFEMDLLRVSSFLLRIALERQRNDQALRVSEERMDAILSNSPLIVFVKDRVGRYLFTNRIFEQRFRLSQCQAIGHTDAELFAPDQAAAFQANDEKVLRSGKPMEFEECARYDDGDHTSIVTKFPLRQPDGTVYAVGGIVTDITERRRTEQALSESRERYALAVAGTADGIWDWNIATNEDYLSPRWKELLGYEDHELPNRTESFFGLLHPDDMDRVQAAIRAHLERCQPYSIELRLRRKDGSYGWFLSRGQAMWDRNGQPLRMVGAITDITRRKETEATLADRARQQAAVAGLGQRALARTELLELFQQAVEIVATTFNVEYCKVLELLPDGSRLKLVAGVGWKEGLVGHATVSGGQDSQAGYTLLRKEPITVEDLRTERRFSGPPLLREHGVVSGISVIIGSIGRPFGVLGAHSTQSRIFSQDDANFFQAVANVLAEAIQRKRAEEELQRSYDRLQTLGREVQWAEEKERRRLSRELHDEFGQLLSALRLSLARVREEVTKRPGTKESVLSKNIMAATKAVEHLFSSLRELVHGLRPAVLDEFGLVVALQSMAEDIRQGTGLDCRLLVEPKNVDSIIGQELMGTLFRIVQELVTNVLRHANATKADIRLYSANGKIALTVQDNGRGGRFAAPTKGYGLRGIRERAELLGGQVEIQSERRRGTTVTVTIPIEPLSRSPGPIGAAHPTMVAKQRKRRHGKSM